LLPTITTFIAMQHPFFAPSLIFRYVFWWVIANRFFAIDFVTTNISYK